MAMAAILVSSSLTLGAHAQRGLRYLVRVCVRSISATKSKSKPRKRYHRDKTKRIKLAIFLKMLRSKVIHFVGVRRSCRALQFILTATEAAMVATQKPNGKLNTAC